MTEGLFITSFYFAEGITVASKRRFVKIQVGG
jgi:hypothetical protein